MPAVCVLELAQQSDYGVCGCLCLQKEGLNLDRIIEEVKMRMARYQVVPNTLIVPPQEKPAAVFKLPSPSAAPVAHHFHLHRTCPPQPAANL